MHLSHKTRLVMWKEGGKNRSQCLAISDISVKSFCGKSLKLDFSEFNVLNLDFFTFQAKILTYSK